MPEITYVGPKDKADLTTRFTVKHEGKTYRLTRGHSAEVPDELAEELLAGSGRVEGHAFIDSKADQEGLEALTVPQLRELAEGDGVDLAGADVKADIIDRIESAHADEEA